ncbi:hypothetical protein VIGAN_04357500 [Vigna angularis var. angularis]|uniref:Uncharacterized protein n=1 Tax=Vigna angularis var. angularis TaxID=157739 RepID=A0A0S3RZL5_PHAAN|nr:hypothetical protein VIGAN_04357500 [Vigna angularis var. angularis]
MIQFEITVTQKRGLQSVAVSRRSWERLTEDFENSPSLKHVELSSVDSLAFHIRCKGSVAISKRCLQCKSFY